MKKLILIVACFIALSAAAQEKKINYELHIRKDGGDTYYSAIIRPINPAKDDYKAYCRYIVKDILKKGIIKEIVIYIFDNKKAYELSKSHENDNTDNLTYAKADKWDRDSRFYLSHVICNY